MQQETPFNANLNFKTIRTSSVLCHRKFALNICCRFLGCVSSVAVALKFKAKIHLREPVQCKKKSSVFVNQYKAYANTRVMPRRGERELSHGPPVFNTLFTLLKFLGDRKFGIYTHLVVNYYREHLNRSHC